MKSILAHCAEARSERLEPGTVLLAEGASPRHRYRPNPPRAPGPSPLETKHLLAIPAIACTPGQSGAKSIGASARRSASTSSSGSHETLCWREKDSDPRSPARKTTLRDCLLIEEVRFAADSPLEGDGFEPSVPRGESACRRSGVRPELWADHPMLGDNP
jgi:hypothetical protein